MTTNSFMPNNDGSRADLLDHLSATLPHYAELLSISADELNTLKADAACFRYTLQTMYDMQSNGQHWTAYKKLLRDGGNGTAEWPLAPKLAKPIPVAVSPGIIPRLSTLAARLKTHRNYTTAIGQDLWLVGTTTTFDPSAWKPVLSIQNKAGHPIIAWLKGKANALEIWVDRGDGNSFVFLTINTMPNTTDFSPLPPSGVSAAWKYKAIYLYHDEQVGQWSDVISCAVGG
ncbi:MAG: hypothetical protein NTX38_06265 [Methylobacter sp.]|nr:hypothetical protein [Methylobacter sp.]